LVATPTTAAAIGKQAAGNRDVDARDHNVSAGTAAVRRKTRCHLETEARTVATSSCGVDLA
jgi:hypothetical protein